MLIGYTSKGLHLAIHLKHVINLTNIFKIHEASGVIWDVDVKARCQRASILIRCRHKKKKQKRKQKQKTIFLKVTNRVSDLEMISLDPGPNWSILPQSQPD